MHTFHSIPKRYEHVKSSDVPNKVKDRFIEIRKTRRGMYIHGSVGTGKTHTVFALLKLIEETDELKGLRAKVWNTSELFAEIKRDFDRGMYDKRHYVEDLQDYKGVLILDDFGSEQPSDWVFDQFYLILNTRYNKVLPTVFTSNLNVQDVAKKFGDRITSRIIEMCDIVEMNGDDRRIKQHKKI